MKATTQQPKKSPRSRLHKSKFSCVVEEEYVYLGSDSNSHHLKYNELNPLTVGMYIWPEQENGDSI